MAVAKVQSRRATHYVVAPCPWQHRELERKSDAALAALGGSACDLGALRVIAGGEANSQQDVARIRGVDRTSMVALLDALDGGGILARGPSEHDRRCNVVELTRTGRQLFGHAESASLAIEQVFTTPLGVDATELRHSLRALLRLDTD